MRLFIIDGEAFPVVCHFDRFWNVHGGNRLEIMKTSEELMEQERSFLADWKAYVGKRAVEGMKLSLITASFGIAGFMSATLLMQSSSTAEESKTSSSTARQTV